ncbi:MAG: DUF2490 domain-containing protein [Chitinophagales bacterium]|nr:DUF2490 domain-containing protein [Chitinophagales bacterium]HNI44911.1 DUF2490 domain-containing protein [Chitinophagales bacterium]
MEKIISTYALRRLWVYFVGVAMLCVADSMVLLAQRQNDFILAPSLSIKKRFSPRWSMDFYQQYQIDENVTELGSFYYDLGINYQPHRLWEIGAAYRYINTRGIENFYETRHRYYAEIAFEPSIGDINLSFRERVQWQQNAQALADESFSASFVNRFKVGAQYSFNWYWGMAMSGEANSLRREGLWQIARITPSVSTYYRFTNQHKIDVNYRMQKNVGRSNSRTDFILAITYFYTL